MNKYCLIDILAREIEIEEQEVTKVYKFSGIQIPMIQRDYAQGREEEITIRERFVRAIFDSLERKKTIELDFVYGSIKVIDNKNYFIPLDGQQRLTTLFLLYWYIGCRELHGGELEVLRKELAGFSYATRATAKLFCQKLSEININFEFKPSEEINNASWFLNNIKFDPTVKAMLVMLDSIHERYGKQVKNLFRNLSDLKFYILPLEGFELTDELYIKMNARGKQLTAFENFKADLINWMQDETNQFRQEFHGDVDLKGRKMPYHVSFATKLDVVWTNLFWEFSKTNEEPEDKVVDRFFLHFLNTYFLNLYITENELQQDSIEQDSIFNKFYRGESNKGEFKYENFDSYKKLLEKNKAIFNLEQVLDRLTEHYITIKQSIKPVWDIKERWDLFSNSISQRQRILFFAITKYLEKNEFKEIKFKNWIRVVWNILVDPNIRNIPAMISAMKLINEMADNSGDIYKYFNSDISLEFISKSSFKTQLLEERVKAILIEKELEFENIIIEAEAHPLFKGNIQFLLPDSENTDKELFINFKEAAFKIFSTSEGKIGVPENYLWLRATLAKCESVSLPITLANGQFDNWRYLINESLHLGITRVIRDCIGQTNCTKVLNKICNDFKLTTDNLWLFHLVKWEVEDKCLLDYSETLNVKKYQGYNEDSEDIYLFNKTNWTDGNIILSNYRNEIVRALLGNSNQIHFNDNWKNIACSFFRGWDIVLERMIKELNFTYQFDRNDVRIGIKSSIELEEQFKGFNFEDADKEAGWICRKKINYSHIKSFEEISKFVQGLETEVFDIKNTKSLLYTLTKK